MRHQIYRSLLFLFVLQMIMVTSAWSQHRTKHRSGKNERTAKAVLWRAVEVPRQDLFYGPGGKDSQPDLSGITFIENGKKGGYSTKYVIKDGVGHKWVAKIGNEAQSETAAVRLLSAIGYQTEINYLVPTLTIPGKGTFTNVRLEARPDNIKRGKEWKWGHTPFEKTREMQGLMLMMAFLNNWDMKSSNNVILRKGDEDLYAISDLGVSFGKTGSNGLPLFWRIGRSRNNPKDYANATFIKSVKKGRVKVSFNGKNRSRMKNFTVADARWLAELLTQLDSKQIRDAFRAANYSQSDVDILTRAVQKRIGQLDRAGSNPGIAGR